MSNYTSFDSSHYFHLSGVMSSEKNLSASCGGGRKSALINFRPRRQSFIVSCAPIMCGWKKVRFHAEKKALADVGEAELLQVPQVAKHECTRLRFPLDLSIQRVRLSPHAAHVVDEWISCNWEPKKKKKKKERNKQTRFPFIFVFDYQCATCVRGKIRSAPS